MRRALRKYHRFIAIILCLPLISTVLSGMGSSIANDWLHQDELGEFFLSIHTLKIFKLGDIFPVLNGIGLLGLLITGLSMSGLFRNRPETRPKE